MKYKCNSCLHIVDSSPCPLCNSTELEPTCDQDHACKCTEDVHDGIRYCPECGDPVCPCGSHSVIALSRITGYVQEVGGKGHGWNKGKKSELKMRIKYDIDKVEF